LTDRDKDGDLAEQRMRRHIAAAPARAVRGP